MNDKDTEYSVKQPKMDAKIFAEQVAYIYHNGPLVYISTLINATLLVVVESPYISFRALLIWYLCLVLLTAARSLLVYQYHKTEPSEVKLQSWHRMYLLGTGLSGLVWGSSAVFLFPADETGAQVFVVIMLAGMTAASVSVLAARMEAFLIFVTPAILPLSVQLFYQGDTVSTTMAVLILIYLVGLSIAARNTHKTILAALSLRFDNHELVAEIEARIQVERELFQEKDRLLITLTSLAEGVVISSVEAIIEFLNPAAEQLMGYSTEQAKGSSLYQILSSLDENTGKETISATETCLNDAAISKKNILLINDQLEKKFVEEIASPLKDPEGNVIGVVTILRDVTIQRKHHQRLTFQANHDPLTRLPNRSLLLDRLHHAIAKAKRDQSLIAVLFIDLDQFKPINDNMGHATGDLLLVAVADRLIESVREQDTVARLGGDEFIIILENLTKEAQISEIIKKIVAFISPPFEINNYTITVTSSIGITIFPRDGQNPGMLLKKADVAMYTAKKKGGNLAQYYGDVEGETTSSEISVNNQKRR